MGGTAGTPVALPFVPLLVEMSLRRGVTGDCADVVDDDADGVVVWSLGMGTDKGVRGLREPDADADVEEEEV